MNLEQIGYRFQKKGAGGKEVLEETKVIVNKNIYIDWSLNSLYEMIFHNWRKSKS